MVNTSTCEARQAIKDSGHLQLGPVEYTRPRLPIWACFSTSIMGTCAKRQTRFGLVSDRVPRLYSRLASLPVRLVRATVFEGRNFMHIRPDDRKQNLPARHSPSISVAIPYTFRRSLVSCYVPHRTHLLQATANMHTNSLSALAALAISFTSGTAGPIEPSQ